MAFGLNGGGNAAFIGREGTGESALLSTAAGVLAPDEGPGVINRNAGILFLPRILLFLKAAKSAGMFLRAVRIIGASDAGTRNGSRLWWE